MLPSTSTVLEDFLEDFRGCVLVVSHDRYFLDRTVDRLFAFENGELRRFEGNYSAYLEKRQHGSRSDGRDRGAAAAGAATATTATTATTASQPDPDLEPAPTPTGRPKPPARARRRSFRENRELEDLESNLPLWEERRGELEALLAGGAEYTRLEALTLELAELSERINAGEERWLELSELAG